VLGALATILGSGMCIDRAHARQGHLGVGARHLTGNRSDYAIRGALRGKLFNRASAGSGIASVYSGGRTASGERMNSGDMTAAHRTLPFGTRVTVTNRRTGKSVVVRINDRGPFVSGRVIDLSPAAARAIGGGDLTQVSLRVGG
jgi:rare lipoprotein A